MTYMPRDGSTIETTELCERLYGNQHRLSSITKFMKGAQARMEGTDTTIWHSSYQGSKSGLWKLVRRT
jgi:hypothetical protein